VFFLRRTKCCKAHHFQVVNINIPAWQERIVMANVLCLRHPGMNNVILRCSRKWGLRNLTDNVWLVSFKVEEFSIRYDVCYIIFLKFISAGAGRGTTFYDNVRWKIHYCRFNSSSVLIFAKKYFNILFFNFISV